MNKITLKTKIGKCGCKIFDVPRFKGLYCEIYCCMHCPDAKTSPCQKEKKEGSVIENLAKTQGC